MTGRPPLTRWSAASAGAALTASLAVWLGVGGGMFSAGPLHAGGAAGSEIGGIRAHAELGDRCGACHAPPWDRGGMAGRCLACHREIVHELADTAGLHGALGGGDPCHACHTEHAGPRASLTRRALDGEIHDRFGFSLARHRIRADGRPFTCDACHAETYAFPRDGCLACHRDYQPAFTADHVRQWGAECRSCHDGSGGIDGSAFEHRFPLRHGRREASECGVCHRDAPSTSQTYTCYGCHEHTPRGIRGEHLEEGIRDFQDCVECHPTGREEEHGHGREHDD